MNKSQRKYLMDEATRIFSKKLNEIESKYFGYSYTLIGIKNFIELNKLENKLKLKFKSKQELVKYIIDMLIKSKKPQNTYTTSSINLYDLQAEILNYETWFDMKNIYDDVSKMENERKEKIEKLENVYNDICDHIMLNAKLNDYINENISDNDKLSSDNINTYFKELEEFEV